MKLELGTILLVCVAVDSMTVGSLETRSVGGNGLELSGDGAERPVGDGNERSAPEADVSGRRRKRSNERPEERAIDRQVRQLKKMKCKPQRVKVNVTDLLDAWDERMGMKLIPQVLAVRRCSHICSYCGDSLGVERAKCVSVRHTTKAFTIKYHEHGKAKYFKQPVRVDRKCKCSHAQ